MVEEFEILIKEDCVNPLPEDRIKYLVTILFKQTYRLVKIIFLHMVNCIEVYFI